MQLEDSRRQRGGGDDLELIRHPSRSHRQGGEDHRRRQQCGALARAPGRQANGNGQDEPEDGLRRERRPLEFQEAHDLLHVEMHVDVMQVERGSGVEQEGESTRGGEEQLDALTRPEKRFEAVEPEHGTGERGAGVQVARQRDDAHAHCASARRDGAQ